MLTITGDNFITELLKIARKSLEMLCLLVNSLENLHRMLFSRIVVRSNTFTDSSFISYLIL